MDVWVNGQRLISHILSIHISLITLHLSFQPSQHPVRPAHSAWVIQQQQQQQQVKIVLILTVRAKCVLSINCPHTFE